MDLKKLGNILAAGGVAVLIGAVAWWYSFFSSIMRDVSSVPGARGEISIFDAKSCIYTSSDFCGLISGGARLLGKTPYEPKVFWIGLAGLVAGLLIRATAKPSVAK
jgi:hypothetical protein